MSASRSSPTIGVNLRGLPLSAVTVSLHYLPKCLRSTVTCDKTSTTVTWNASSKICCHVIVTQQRPIVEQFTASFETCLSRQTSGFSELQAHSCMLSKQWTWLLRSVSIMSANKLSLQELTQLIRIKLLISRLRNFASWSQFPGGRGNARFALPCGRPCFWDIFSS